MKNTNLLARQNTIISEFDKDFLSTKKKNFTREEIETFIKIQSHKEKDLIETIWNASRNFSNDKETRLNFEEFYNRTFGDIKNLGITEFRPVMFTVKEKVNYKTVLITKLGFWVEYYENKDKVSTIPVGQTNAGSILYHGSEKVGNSVYGIMSRFHIYDWSDIVNWEYVDYDKLFPFYHVVKLQNVFLPISNKPLMKKLIKVYSDYVKSEKLFLGNFEEYKKRKINIQEYILNNIKYLEEIVSKCGNSNIFPVKADRNFEFEWSYFWINNRGVLDYGNEFPEYRHTGKSKHNDYGIEKLKISEREEDKKEPEMFMFTEEMLQDFIDFQHNKGKFFKPESTEIISIKDFKINKLHKYTLDNIFHYENTKITQFQIENFTNIESVKNYFKENKISRDCQQFDWFYTSPINFEKETAILYGYYFVIDNEKFAINCHRSEYIEFDETKIISEYMEYGSRYINQLASNNWKSIDNFYQKIIDNNGQFERQYYVAEVPQKISMFLNYKL